MKFRKTISLLFAALLVVNAIPHTALAADWYLENGSIRVEADDSGQTVFQGTAEGVADSAPVITQQDPSTATNHTITLESSGDAVVSVTIEDVNMQGSCNEEDEYTLIDVVGDSNAVIQVEGDNYLYAPDNDEEAIIHVGAGSLTIQGNGSLEIEGDANGAKIGSDDSEEFSGSVTITGDTELITQDNGSYDGAAIGSGQDADFTGTVVIGGNARVEARSNDRGAGIGAGEEGDFRGEVIIEGNAQVRADGDDDSAGIGSGQYGSFSGGTILIRGDARVHASGSDEGPGIGAADDTPMNGTILIGGNAQVEVEGGDECDVDIGSEGGLVDTGVIRFEENASVVHHDGETLVIGSEYPEEGTELSIYVEDTVHLNGTSGEDVLAGLGDVELRANYISAAAPAPAVETAAFWVLDENMSELKYSSRQEEDTLIITVDADYASLRAVQGTIQQLCSRGIEEIRFETSGADSEFELEDLAGLCANGTEIILIHDGETVIFTAGGADAKDILD